MEQNRKGHLRSAVVANNYAEEQLHHRTERGQESSTVGNDIHPIHLGLRSGFHSPFHVPFGTLGKAKSLLLYMWIDLFYGSHHGSHFFWLPVFPEPQKESILAYTDVAKGNSPAGRNSTTSSCPNIFCFLGTEEWPRRCTVCSWFQVVKDIYLAATCFNT